MKTGWYRHYKGSYYWVLGTARHTETEELLVVYQSADRSRMWARPYDMFHEEIRSPLSVRFQYVAAVRSEDIEKSPKT